MKLLENGSPGIGRKIFRIIVIFILLSWIIGLLLTPVEDAVNQTLSNSNKIVANLVSYIFFTAIVLLTFLISKKILQIEAKDWRYIATVLIILNVVLHFINILNFQYLSYVYQNIGREPLVEKISIISTIISLVVESLIIFVGSWFVFFKISQPQTFKNQR